MRLLVRALVVVSSVAIAVLAWRYLRPRTPVPSVPVAIAPRNTAPKPLDPASLPNTYQGPITRGNGNEEWLVLEITSINLAADDEITFAFTLTSASDTVRDQGRASLRDRWIRFAGMSGEIRTREEDRAPLLRSVPISGPPNWMLEPPRAASRTTGVPRT